MEATELNEAILSALGSPSRKDERASLLLHCRPDPGPWQLCDVKVLKEKPSFGHLFVIPLHFQKQRALILHTH